MKRKLYIRVEGNSRVGLGHFIRCIALSEILDAHFNLIFVGVDLPQKILQDKNLDYLEIKKEEDFFRQLLENDIVVVDGYDFDNAYYRRLKSTKVIVVSIQDIQHYSQNIDLVINHLPDSQKFYKDVEMLEGPKHAIIRKKFLELPVKKTYSTDNEVFISLGGTNNFKLVNKIVEMLDHNEEYERINILTTDSNKPKIVGKNLSLFSNINEDKIVELIDGSSVCLITSGMISYEVLARNQKAIVGALNEGQDDVGKKFESMNLIQYLGYWKNIDQLNFSKSLDGENIKTKKVRSIFDGKSGERILNKFSSL